jgi:hypothetical protein
MSPWSRLKSHDTVEQVEPLDHLTIVSVPGGITNSPSIARNSVKVLQRLVVLRFCAMQAKYDKFSSPCMDDPASEPGSARIGSILYADEVGGSSTRSSPSFFYTPMEQHLVACAWFNEGVARAVAAGAAACPDKERLLYALMANVEAAINAFNAGLKLVQETRLHETEVR